MTEARFVLTRSRARGAEPPPPAPPRQAPPSCGHGSRPAGPAVLPAVWVDGVEIEPELIARETQNHPGPDPAQAWEAAARALVVREILLAEARRRALRAEPEPLGDNRLETEEESLIRQVLEAALQLASPSEAECRRVYEGMREKFVTPTLFEAAHILIEPAGDDELAWAEAEAEARAIIGMVGDDPCAFAEAATARSACPTASQGGSLGQVRRGELAAPVQAAIEALQAGAIGGEPVRTQFGWHVVRLERRIEGRALPYEIVADRIRDMLEARAWALGAARYVADLAAQAQIEGVRITPQDGGFSACEEGRGC